LPAPLGAAGAGRTTPPPPPEADIVAPPPPPPPQASARKICNFPCSKVKSITQTEERFAFDDPGLPADRPAGEALKIRLPGGGALLLCVLPGASADAVVRRAAAACGLAPSQLALFCGGRRLGGPAPLSRGPPSRAGGVRSGGTLRVVQRLAGGAPEYTHEAALTGAFRTFAGGNGRITKDGFVAALTRPGGGRAITREEAEAEFGRFEAGDDGAVPCEAIAAAWTVPAPPPHLAPEAEEPARVAAEEAVRLATEQAATEEAARMAAEEAARLATEQAAAEEASRVTAARLATEQAAAEEPVRVAAGEAAYLAAEQAAAEEPARVAADRPPHLPPAREVKVDEEKMVKWKKRGGTELEAVLKTGAVALLDAEWVIACAASGGVLLPRQALPDEAFLSISEVQARTGNCDLSVVCVSHCWLQPNHPDPRGYNLRAVARALASLTSGGKRFGVFLDFCSIHQNCRDGRRAARHRLRVAGVGEAVR